LFYRTISLFHTFHLYYVFFSLAWPFSTSASLLSQQASCLIPPSSTLPPPPPPVVHHKTSITRHRTTTHLETKQKKSSTLSSTINSTNSTSNIKQQSIVPAFDQPSKQSLSPKKEALTFHLHTHHHHHIHNPNPPISSNTSSLLKSPNPTKTTTVPLSPQKSCVLGNKELLVETKTILPLSVNNVVKKEHQQITTNDLPSSPPIEHEALNFSIKHLSAYKKPNVNENEGTVRKTPRKSSPTKVRLSSESKSNR
jgi:hypothetical protein